MRRFITEFDRSRNRICAPFYGATFKLWDVIAVLFRWKKGSLCKFMLDSFAADFRLWSTFSGLHIIILHPFLFIYSRCWAFSVVPFTVNEDTVAHKIFNPRQIMIRNRQGNGRISLFHLSVPCPLWNPSTRILLTKVRHFSWMMLEAGRWLNGVLAVVVACGATVDPTTSIPEWKPNRTKQENAASGSHGPPKICNGSRLSADRFKSTAWNSEPSDGDDGGCDDTSDTSIWMHTSVANSTKPIESESSWKNLVDEAGRSRPKEPASEFRRNIAAGSASTWTPCTAT